MWSKDHWCNSITCNVECYTMCATKRKQILFVFSETSILTTSHLRQAVMLPKIKATVYIEWQRKSCSLSWYTSLWVQHSFSFCILALKRPTFTGTRVSGEDLHSYSEHYCVYMWQNVFWWTNFMDQNLQQSNLLWIFPESWSFCGIQSTYTISPSSVPT